MYLANKVAVITGGSSGIGRATVLKFAREGACVVVADLNEAGGQAVVAEVQGAGGQAIFCRTNVADFAQVEQAVNLAVASFGNLHIMFNNAGIGHLAPLLDQTPESYDKVVKVNQYGVFYGILAAGRKMRDLGTAGVIINTASVFALLASPGVISYHASKAAVKLMSQAAALELAPYNIRVIAIAPGGVDTPIIQGYKDMGMGEAIARQQMRGRLLQPEEIANAVALLASDDANAINGSMVMVDDGYAEFK
jgi:glucose 1-dehydrogenase